MINPHDQIRDKILRRFYEIHKKGQGNTLTHVEASIRDLEKIISNLGIDKGDFYSNLDYLVQKGWVIRHDRTETQADRFGAPRTYYHISYRISAEGIDRLEEASAYRREELYGKINITNIKGVTVIGSGNVVNLYYTDLSRALTELELAITASEDIPDWEKLDLTSDLATIQSQLSKSKPDKGLIEKVWNGIEKIVTASGFVDVVSKITTLIDKIPT